MRRLWGNGREPLVRVPNGRSSHASRLECALALALSDVMTDPCGGVPVRIASRRRLRISGQWWLLWVRVGLSVTGTSIKRDNSFHRQTDDGCYWTRTRREQRPGSVVCGCRCERRESVLCRCRIRRRAVTEADVEDFASVCVSN